MKRVTRLDPAADLPAPPYAALDLHQDQIRTGHRTPRRPGEPARDRLETAATWERDGMKGPITASAYFARVARAFLTGKSPRTRRGRWRRDLDYLELVYREAELTLPAADLAKYGDMVAAWRARKPLGPLGRYLAALSRKRRQA